MRPVTVQVGPLATADADGYAQSQTPGAAGNLTLNGALAGVADVARRVLITTVSNESGKTLTIYGTNWAGDSISETMTGPNATTGVSVLSYKTVTRIAVSAAFTGAVTAGTNGIADSPWIRFDDYAPADASVQVTVSGTVNYTVRTSNDDPNSPTNVVTPANMTWVDCLDTALVAATATKSSNFQKTPLFARITLNSQTNPGYVVGTFLQQSNGPR